MIQFPDTFPRCKSAVVVGRQSDMQLTRMDSGRVRQRRKYFSRHRTIRVSWEMSDEQYLEFQAWFLFFTEDGAKPFKIMLPLSGPFYEYEAQFASGEHRARAMERFRWDVTVDLEVFS